MARSVFVAVGIVCLAVSAASAQMPNYWLATPPSVVGAPPAPPPPPEIPNVPFAPARDVQSLATFKIDQDFKLMAPQAPLWMGSNEVALLGTRHGQVTLLAYYGEHFANSHVLADPSTVNGGTILDIAISPDAKHVAIAAASNDKLQIWLRDIKPGAPASAVAAMDGAFSRAGIAWLDAATLAVGAESEATAAPPPTPAPAQDATQPPADNREPPAAPARSLHVVDIGKRESARLDLDCLGQVDPTAIVWSPDGNYGLGQVVEQDKWMLIDRSKVSCEVLKLPGIAPAGFIEWAKESPQFLFTATPARLRDTPHIGVMEYSLNSHKATLLASPATAAAYVNAGRIAILGSRHLNAATMVQSSDTLLNAEIAWINPRAGDLNIVPIGFKTTAAELLGARLRYSAKGVLATSFQTPGSKGAFTVLLWLSTASDKGGVLGTGRIGRVMLANWSPDGSKLAVLAGLPEAPTLAIIASPQ